MEQTLTFRDLVHAIESNREISGTINARDLFATDFATGGAFVGQDTLTAIVALRESSTIAGLGITSTVQPGGSKAAATIGSGATAYWLGETEPCPVSDIATGNVIATPKRVAARVRVSKQLLMQGGALFENALRADLRGAVGEKFDLAALQGIAGAGEPAGLFFRPEIPTLTFGGAATAAKIADFGRVIRDAKVIGQLAWIVSPTTAAKWRVTVGVAGVSTLFAVAESIAPVVESTFAIGDRVALGRWGDFWAHEFGAEIETNPFTRAEFGQVEVNINYLVDAAPLRAAAFVTSTDSGAQ